MAATDVVPPSVSDPSPPTPTSQPVVISQPNATLYISNIDWSVKKNILRRALLALFERHGKVLEVVTLRREGLRGQAWVIFEDISSATAACKAETGFKFFGKELKVVYAREKSDRIAKQDGTYVPKDRRAKRARILTTSQQTNSTATNPLTSTGAGSDSMAVTSDNPSAPLPPGTVSSHDPEANGDPDTPSDIPPPPPPPATDQEGAGGVESTSMDTEEHVAPPSNILFAQDLPSECNEMMLAMLFRQYLGYKEVRIPRQGLAFVEFDDEPHATLALRGLNGFQLTTTDTLNLKYGKKN